MYVGYRGIEKPMAFLKNHSISSSNFTKIGTVVELVKGYIQTDRHTKIELISI